MPITEFDEVYRKKEDGTMELVSSTPRIVTDNEIEIEQAKTKVIQAISQLDVLLAKPKVDWTTGDVKDASYIAIKTLRGLLRYIYKQ